MAKEVMKKETSAAPSVWVKKTQAKSNIDRADILIPKLLLMQGLSELVSEEKAQMGEVVNSITGQVLGGKDKGLTFIPLLHYKDIAQFEVKDGDKPKFKQLLPWNAETATLPWEQWLDGVQYRNMKRLNFYVLLESEVEKPTALPYLLSFVSTSYQNGRKLVTHFAQADMANLEPFSYMFNLTTKKEKNDKGIYYIFDVLPAKETPAEYASKIETWTTVLGKGSYQVDESDFETGATAEKEAPRSASSQAPAQF